MKKFHRIFKETLWLSKALFLLVLLITFTRCSESNVPERPNILFIAVDDLKPMLNCYGQHQIHSPNIDRIAEMGAVFHQNYCQQAVCGPSRASLLTGLFPDHTGVWDLKTRMRDVNPDVLALPQYFRQNGYATAAFGKIYDPRCVGPAYDSASWSIPYINNNDFKMPEGYSEPMFGHYQDPETRKAGEALLKEAAEQGLEGYARVRYGLEQLKPVVEAADVPDNAYMDGVMTENAIKMMEEFASGDAPFFLAVGYKKPHLPFVAPTKYWDLYERDEINLAPFQEHSKNGPEIAYHNSGELRSYTGFEFVNGIIPEDQQREIIHGYYAAVSYIDALIGNVLDRLEALGLSDNTIIVLWGDHGWHLGDHALWCKHSNFEQATRAPMIIASPGTQGRLNVKSPTDFIDIFPTLCELAGLEIPEQLDGVSLVPILKGETGKVKEFSMSQYPRGRDIMGYSLRTERYRYTEWINDSYRSYDPYDKDKVVARELYDYEADTFETVNFIDDPAYADVQAALSSEMEKFLSSQENMYPGNTTN